VQSCPVLRRTLDSVMLSSSTTAGQSFERKVWGMHTNKAGVAVIGGGLAGLSAANSLTEANVAVMLFERNSTLGGRLGSDTQTDMGAQYFTARHPAFRQACREWEADGWIAEWSPRLYRHDLEQGLRPSSDDIQRLVGVPGMATLADHLQQSFARQQATITQLQQATDGEWILQAADGAEYGPFTAVVLAIPPASAAELLYAAPSLQQDVARVRMRPCWSLAMTFEQPLPTQVDACFVRDGPLDWLARNNSKPQRAGNESWVLQSTSTWAEQHEHDQPARVITELSRAMEQITGLTLPAPSSSQARYWAQARPAEELKWGALAAPRLNLYICGDWCLGGRMENAWLSGRQAAKALLDS